MERNRLGGRYAGFGSLRVLLSVDGAYRHIYQQDSPCLVSKSRAVSTAQHMDAKEIMHKLELTILSSSLRIFLLCC